MNKEDLKNQIWTTRISRVNAEKRLVKKESFCQGINVYYSCATIIFSILSLLKHDDTLSLMTIFMTISLLIVILYLNSQKYLENAREYRKNYTQLQMLEFKIRHIKENEDEKLEKIEEKYCELLGLTNNHIEYDYYCTVYNSNDEYKNKKWHAIRLRFYFNWGWRFIVKITLLILPFVIYILCEVV